MVKNIDDVGFQAYAQGFVRLAHLYLVNKVEVSLRESWRPLGGNAIQGPNTFCIDGHIREVSTVLNELRCSAG